MTVHWVNGLRIRAANVNAYDELKKKLQFLVQAHLSALVTNMASVTSHTPSAPVACISDLYRALCAQGRATNYGTSQYYLLRIGVATIGDTR